MPGCSSKDGMTRSLSPGIHNWRAWMWGCVDIHIQLNPPPGHIQRRYEGTEASPILISTMHGDNLLDVLSCPTQWSKASRRWGTLAASISARQEAIMRPPRTKTPLVLPLKTSRAGIYTSRECDSTTQIQTMPTNMAKHRLSCPVRAQSGSVSSIGPLVTWYVSSRPWSERQQSTDHLCSVSSYVSRLQPCILNLRYTSLVGQGQKSFSSNKLIPIQNGSFLSPLRPRASFFRLEVPMLMVSWRSHSIWHQTFVNKLYNSHGAVSDRHLRARGHQLANQGHGSSLLQSCYPE